LIQQQKTKIAYTIKLTANWIRRIFASIHLRTFRFPLSYQKNVKLNIYRTVTLPVVSDGCETWSFALRKEFRLRMFEVKVLRRIFERKREEVVRGWRRLYNDNIHILSSHQILLG